MSWLRRVFGGKRGEPDHHDASCSFCGKHRREVRKLVAGPGVYICDECVVLCADILQDEHRKEGGDFRIEQLLADAARRGPRAAHAELRPMLRAVVELAGGERDALVRAATLAYRADDVDTAVAALAAVSEADRQLADELTRVAGLLALRRLDDARALLDRLDGRDDLVAGSLDDVRRRLYRTRLALEGGSLPRPQLAVHLQAARELSAAIAPLPDDELRTHARSERLALVTRGALALGDLELAHEAAHERLSVLDGAAAHEALADVLRARGDLDGAARALARARELAHPDGVVARRLAAAGGRAQPYR